MKFNGPGGPTGTGAVMAQERESQLRFLLDGNRS